MALAPPPFNLTDNQDTQGCRRPQHLSSLPGLNSINNLCKGGAVKQKEARPLRSRFESGSLSLTVPSLGSKVSDPSREVR